MKAERVLYSGGQNVVLTGLRCSWDCLAIAAAAGRWTVIRYGVALERLADDA